MDHWIELRKQGIQTPYIAPWVNSPQMEDPTNYPHNQLSWKWFLNYMYNNETRAELIWKRPGSDKMVYFTRGDDTYNNDTVNEAIEYNDGKQNIEVIKMWAFLGLPKLRHGYWSF